MRPRPRCGPRRLAVRRAAPAALITLLAGCTASPSDAPDRTTDGAQQRVAALRAAAALPPCPSGLGPDLPELTLPCLSGGPDVTSTTPDQAGRRW